jgi:hypothetical protein
MPAARLYSRRVVVALNLVLWGLLAAVVGWWAAGALRERAETERSTARYDPAVWAGQSVIPACSGGFYARDGQTIVLTLSAHCLEPGVTLRDADGHLLGVVGPRAQLADCPEHRFCAPSDFLTLAIAKDAIPWGHLNVIDMGAGGYRTFGRGTRPLSCADISIDERVEVDGRERFRTGRVLEVGPYEFETDTMFPCMVVANIPVDTGDSGGAVLVDGQPAGVIARRLGVAMGFTPLAEGLENLDLTLCTTPDCELTPGSAVQPAA